MAVIECRDGVDDGGDGDNDNDDALLLFHITQTQIKL